MVNAPDKRVKTILSTPIYVDLDGTLIFTDTLYESLVGMLKIRPLLFFLLPFWLLRGKAHLKFKIAGYFTPSPEALPYNTRLVDFLKKERAKGRPIILATASSMAIAQNIARYLGLFDQVLASCKHTNLKGEKKLSSIQAHCQNSSFAYVGDADADLLIWQKAEEVIVAGNNAKIKRKIKQANITIAKDLCYSKQNIFSALLKSIRPHQWSKNLLVFVSIILAHQVNQLDLLISVIIAFMSFCFCAAGIYLMNDLVDLEVDRHHKHKCSRPLAKGTLPVIYALLCVPFFLLTSGLLAMLLPQDFRITIFVYFLLTIIYLFKLKQVVLLDVILLSLLYAIRVIAGSNAIGISTTPWLLGFSIFIFLSLALAKRYSELLENKSIKVVEKIRGRGYMIDDIEQLAIFGSTSGYMSVLVLALYLNSSEVAQLYNRIELLWFICVLLIYWISRIWLIARRGQLHEDPIIFIIRDKVSYIIGFLTVFILILAAI